MSHEPESPVDESSGPQAVESEALAESKALFVRRWGEMGIYWGISRTMAEIHALLYISTEALCTDDIMEQLQVSRGNASMNVRGLIDWGLVRRVHLRGDRKEYFTAETNTWRLFETIMRERRRRELEPIAGTIQKCIAMVEHSIPGLAAGQRSAAQEYRKRLQDMHAFLSTVSSLLNLALELGPNGMKILSKLLSKASAGR
jgi:DNA-binding transcriptional regulator GbsR (MarR family)